MKKEFKLPTILALILLVIGVIAGVFLIQSDKIFTLQASPEEVPQQIRITNLTHNSFVVSWITDKPTQGFVAYGKSASLGNTAQQQITSATQTHYVLVENLTPQTTYFFKVGSGAKQFDNNGQLYQTKTSPQLSSTPPSPDIVFGKVLDQSRNPANEAIIYISLLGITPQSVLTDSQGSWSISLSTVRNTPLTGFASYAQDALVEIFVQGGAGKIATAKIKIKDAHPVPTITIGQNHDFTNLKTLPPGTLPKSQLNLPTGSESQKSSGFEVGETPQPSSQKTISITSISENESINTTKPTLSGTGTTGLSFTIKVESPTIYTGTVTVDSKGKWSWTLPSTLDPGSHSITISWKDENNQTRLLIRKFTVLAVGSSEVPAFTASSSASTTPSTGSASLTTPTPTPKATALPTPTSSSSARISYPATTSGVPESGYLTPSIGIFIMGMILIVAGIFFPNLKKQD